MIVVVVIIIIIIKKKKPLNKQHINVPREKGMRGGNLADNFVMIRRLIYATVPKRYPV